MLNFILDKHYSLWNSLKTPNNIRLISEMISHELDEIFFDGKSKFIFFLDLIFILIIGFFFIKAMWLSTVPKVSDNRQSQFAKIIFISIYFLYLFGMIKVTYF